MPKGLFTAELMLAVCLLELKPVGGGVCATETLVLLCGILLMSVIHIKYVPGLAIRFEYCLVHLNITADRGVHRLCCLLATVLISRETCFSII